MEKNQKLSILGPQTGPFWPKKSTIWVKNDAKNAIFSKKNFRSKTLSDGSRRVLDGKKPKIKHFGPPDGPILAQKVHNLGQKWLKKRDFLQNIFLVKKHSRRVLDGKKPKSKHFGPPDGPILAPKVQNLGHKRSNLLQLDSIIT